MTLAAAGNGNGARDIERLLLKPKDAARALSLSPRLLWTLTHRGEIPCIRIGRAVRYDPCDLKEVVRKMKGAPGQVRPETEAEQIGGAAARSRKPA